MSTADHPHVRPTEGVEPMEASGSAVPMEGQTWSPPAPEPIDADPDEVWRRLSGLRERVWRLEVELARTEGDLAVAVREASRLRAEVARLRGDGEWQFGYQTEAVGWRGRAEAHRKALTIAAAAITRVRELHRETVYYGVPTCEACEDDYPCSTLALLDSPNTEEPAERVNCGGAARDGDTR